MNLGSPNDDLFHGSPSEELTQKQPSVKTYGRDLSALHSPLLYTRRSFTPSPLVGEGGGEGENPDTFCLTALEREVTL